MDKDKDKLVPLQKLLKENTPIAGTSNETSDNIYQNIKMETKDFSDSSDEDSSEQKSKIGKKRGSVKLPVHLKGLMGEANLRFARGDHATAEKMCFEVIRQCPHASEAYLTLAQLYESVDPEKSFQYNMIAAHLRPRDVNQWLKIAQYYIDMGNLKQAVLCYSKAINANPNNIGLHRKRIEVLEVLGDAKAVLRYKVRLAAILNPNNHEEVIKICLEAAGQYYALKEYHRAIKALNIPFERFPEKVDFDLLNLMLDLLLITTDYSKCLDIFVEFCDIELDLVVDDSEKINVLSFTMPEKLVIDLRIKFIICLIKMEAKDLALPLLDELLKKEDVEEIGDLYLDVAEALMSMNWHQDALKFLVPLVKSKKYSLAAVWLKHAECLNACEMYEEAIESYVTVMTLAPQHAEVRYPLSMLLLKMGKKDEALKVLTQDPDKQELNAGLLVKRMELLKQIEDFDEYYKTFELLLSRHCVIVKRQEELKALTYCDYPAEKITRIRKIRDLYGELLNPKPIFSTAGELSLQQECTLFKQVLQLCKDRGDYHIMQKFAFSVLTSTKLNRGERVEEFALLAFLSCLYNRDAIHGYSLIRELFLRHPKNHLIFNLFNALLQLGVMDIRYNRFLMRCLKNVIMSDKLHLLAGNYGLCVGNYNYAIQNYIYLFRKCQSPFLCLVLGVLLVQCCNKKSTSNRKELTATTLALFTQYANKRGVQALQEVKYNMGRMFHAFGMVHIAEIYYLDVLSYNSPEIEQYPDILDLKMEAAYNLHLIYRDSGNLEAARQVLFNYLVI